MKQSISKIITNDGNIVEIESKYLVNVAEDEIPIIKIREDLIEVYDDMDYREKFYMRREFLDIRRNRWGRYKDELWKAIVDKNYTKQIEFLSEMFIQYLSDSEFYEFIVYINSKDRLDIFFSIFENSDIRFVKSVHAVLLSVLSEYYDID